MNNIEELTLLIKLLKEQGFIFTDGDYGDYDMIYFDPADTVESIVDKIIAETGGDIDMNIHVKLPDKDKEYCLWLVFGNGPGELLADYVVHPLIEAVADRVDNLANGRPEYYSVDIEYGN